MLIRDRTTLIKITIFYAIFIIFGSFVPFNVNQLTFGEAVQGFSDLNKFDFAIVNRSDWFTNFLLFMPITYLLLMVIQRSHSRLIRTLQLIFICAALLCISAGIEFVQFFLNDRVSSFKDVFAQFLGMLLSFILYLFTRVKFIRLVNKLNRYGGKNKWISYANGTLAVLVIYSLMPLDLSVSPVEIFKKWQAGRITIIPFASFEFSINEGVFGIMSDIFLWGFITWLYIKSAKYQANYILKLCLMYALGIELAQLFVLSRYTDATDVVSAFIGIMIALKFFTAQHVSTQRNDVHTTQVNRRFSLYAQEALCVAWCVLLLFLAVYPFEFIQNKAALFSNFQGFFSVPLETYWREGPLQAVTQLLRKVLLVAPLGILLASIAFKHQLHKQYRIMLGLAGIAFLFVLELLQIFIVNKVAVASDVGLNLLGLFLGQKVYLMHSSQNKTPERRFDVPQNYKKYYLLAVFVMLAISLYFIQGDDRTPYNVKELFTQDFVWLSSIMMSLSLMVAFALPPIALDKLTARKKTSALTLLGLSVAHCLLVFNLFYMTFPNESLFDILGYPTWRDQSHYLELGYRFLGFYLPISAAFLLVYCWLTPTKSIGFKGNRLAFSLLYAFFVLPVSYWVVVVQAGTDNIIELLPNNGHSFKLLYIVGYILLLIYASGWWVKKAPSASRMKRAAYCFVTVVSAPLGFYLIQHGMQDVIIKYGRVFSGLQFILSPSRESLLSQEQLFFRFSILHFMLLIMFFINGFAAKTLSPRPSTGHTLAGAAG
ncbi:hypothetical protein GPLA_0354 [Paraglaciecola polaris LMG 21857]|uniref:VanZ-like domain-containing protein n=1 Tax=Paraglaciecola polaris LMG 21857 TaxID=1129793 RepID=K6ZQY4_9ALTE|nr:hypothetical protein GPLA_0354 [Paraglaciecola polaris LMG 21857]